MRFPGGGFGGIATVFSDIVAGLFFIICLAVVVGLIFLVVRFLIVATKAAQLYVDKNSPAPAATPAQGAAAPTASTPTVVTPTVVTPTVVAPAATAKPASSATTRAPRKTKPKS